jgi:hypothetical protein
MLRDQGDEWRAEAREIDRRLFQADMLWGHGDYRTEDLQTFVLRVTELNCVLLDESNLRELMHTGGYGHGRNHAEQLSVDCGGPSTRRSRGLRGSPLCRSALRAGHVAERDPMKAPAVAAGAGVSNYSILDSIPSPVPGATP